MAMECAVDVHSHDGRPIFRVRTNAQEDRSRRPQVFAWLRHAAHFFSSTHSTRDRVAPEGHDRDPRATTRLYRFSAQSRMTIESPPPTQPSCAARSSSSQVRSGGVIRPISAHTSYAASNLGHVIGGQRFFVSLAVVVEQRRSCKSDRFFPEFECSFKGIRHSSDTRSKGGETYFPQREKENERKEGKTADDSAQKSNRSESGSRVFWWGFARGNPARSSV
ncbi:uncharacterized protein LOC122574021 isoform X2 [Bombus pyrosoma]|uniref:uncharacterized protein LOC122574021 isoform X2 n=1 Tax=Bombus pyrosoma TaxID=396416 RepID=UPI001CB9CD1B|nr:uncharacterized protein LOC122574021 isoform X2 [Bombus pyrosoma]